VVAEGGAHGVSCDGRRIKAVEEVGVVAEVVPAGLVEVGGVDAEVVGEVGVDRLVWGVGEVVDGGGEDGVVDFGGVGVVGGEVFGEGAVGEAVDCLTVFGIDEDVGGSEVE
jgi:hypothetical protein